MTMMTISQVSKHYGLTTRTLRYYEQIGLISSHRQEDYAYRTYDEAAMKQIQQILVLRQLRIPLKQIAFLMKDPDLRRSLTVFEDSLNEIDGEVEALLKVRGILGEIIQRMSHALSKQLPYEPLGDEALLLMMELLSNSKMLTREDTTMEELNKSNDVLDKLKQVRILHLPPMTVASSQYFGKNPEEHASEVLHEFVRKSGLADLKPDLRIFGFNNPCEPDANGLYGYEFWVTIPENLEVQSPLVKKHFAGGLYGAHAIQMGNFHEWRLLVDWAKENGDYDHDIREPLGMAGSLEEHLNAYQYYKEQPPQSAQFTQLDLLIPIKTKTVKE